MQGHCESAATKKAPNQTALFFLAAEEDGKKSASNKVAPGNSAARRGEKIINSRETLPVFSFESVYRISFPRDGNVSAPPRGLN